MFKRGWSFGVRIELLDGLRALRTRPAVTSCAGERRLRAHRDGDGDHALSRSSAAAISGPADVRHRGVRFASQRTLAEQVPPAQIETIRALRLRRHRHGQRQPGREPQPSRRSAVPGLPGTTQTTPDHVGERPGPDRVSDLRRLQARHGRDHSQLRLGRSSASRARTSAPRASPVTEGSPTGSSRPQVIDMGNNQPHGRRRRRGLWRAERGLERHHDRRKRERSLFPALTPNPTSGGAAVLRPRRHSAGRVHGALRRRLAERAGTRAAGGGPDLQHGPARCTSRQRSTSTSPRAAAPIPGAGP